MTTIYFNSNSGATCTLQRYVTDVFVPAKMAKDLLSKRAAQTYRSLLNRFYEFAGDSIACGDIDLRMIDRFYSWMIERGYSRSHARHGREAVRCVLRHWNPDTLPDQRGAGNPSNLGAFIEADIEGSLEQIFKCDYLPERTSISSPQTIKQYARCLRLFSMYLGETATPIHLTDKIVGKFLRWLVEVEGVKPVTGNGYVKQVKALWTWLAKKRVVERFPTIEKLKQPDPMPDAWTREELQKLIAACRQSPGRIGRIAAAGFWTAFHYVLWDTGERTGAMLSLCWDWYDPRKRCLSVPGEFRKGRQKSMVYSLKQTTAALLTAIRQPRRELIFELYDGQEGPPPDSRRGHYFYKPYRRLVESAGLPYVSHKSGPQKMRRTFASHIEAAGGNATRALKHRDRRVTEDSYLDPKVTEVESENQKLFPLSDAGE
jgi:integrase